MVPRREPCCSCSLQFIDPYFWRSWGNVAKRQSRRICSLGIPRLFLFSSVHVYVSPHHSAEPHLPFPSALIMIGLAPASDTLDPLPDVLAHGLVAVSTFALVSFSCSASLFFYLSWRLITWRSKTGPNPPVNQFFVLIYNLLLADIQQALAFLLNINSLRNNAILVGTPACFAQGWFVSTGDLASSVFICAIAFHTFFSVVKDYRLSSNIFYGAIAAAWTFVYAMAAIGPMIHGRLFFVRASAWVSNKSDRHS